ncbi:unnamed protein product [Knipowitschia caucasica]
MLSLSGLWCYCLMPRRAPLLSLTVLLLLSSASSSPESCSPRTQPCHILSRIGYSVRMGALLPSRQPARIQNALNRALTSLRHQSAGSDTSSGATTTSSQSPPLLPYNLTLDMLARIPIGGDPDSLSRSTCQDLVVRGVSAVLAFPRSKEELLQLDFFSSFLEIPFVSILEDTEPLKTKVRALCLLDFR